MRIQVPQGDSSARKFNFGTIFSIVLALAWLRSTVVSYTLIFIKRIPYIGVPIATIYPIVFGILLLIALPWMCKRLRLFELLFYGFAVVVVFGTTILYPQYTELIDNDAGRILLSAVPMLFLGVCYDHKRHQNVLFYASILALVVQFAYQNYQLATGRDLLEESMHQAYLALPHVLYVVYIAAVRKKLGYTIIGVAAACTVLIYGTRGPLLCILIFWCVCLFMNILTNSSKVKRIVYSLFVLAILLIALSGDLMIQVSQTLSEWFGDIGFSTRVFDYFIEGEIAEGNGRETLISRAFALLSENPLWGYGVMSDRVLVHNYPHNLFVELWFQFGYVFGTALAALFVALPVLAICKHRHDRSKVLLLCALVCMNYVKLMFSSSYLVEPYFFFTLGVCLMMIREPVQKGSISNKKRPLYDKTIYQISSRKVRHDNYEGL